MNLKIREFQTAIENFVNSSDVPAEVKRLVLCDLARKIEEQANAEVVKEFTERESEKSKEEKKDE